MLIGMGKLRVARAARCVVALLFVLSLNLSTVCLADDFYIPAFSGLDLSQETSGDEAESHGDHSHTAKIHTHAFTDTDSNSVADDNHSSHTNDGDAQGQCDDCEGHVHCCHAFLEAEGAPISFPLTLKRLQAFAATPILGLPAATLLRPPRTAL